MMEVKQNTPTDFNNLIASNSNGKSDDLDVMSSLSAAQMKTDLLSTNELSENGLLSAVTGVNGSDSFTDTAEALDLDDYIDLNESVNPDLEDELLADDGANVVDKLLAEVVPKAAEIIDDDVAIVGINESVTLSSRNPGDDLDTLLSKINDLKDCIETETVPSLENSEKANDSVEVQEKPQEITEEVVKIAETISELTAETLTKPVENNQEVIIVETAAAIPTENENIKAECAKQTVEDAEQSDETVASVTVASETTDASKSADEVVTKTITDCKETVTEPDTKVMHVTQDTDSSEKDVPTVTLDDSLDEAMLPSMEIKDEKLVSSTLDSTETRTAKEAKTTNLEAEDSDDDVIFLAEKSSDSTKELKQSKQAEAVEAVESDTKVVDNAKQNSTIQLTDNISNSPMVDDDDDVVLLDDDDDEKVTEAASINEKSNKLTGTKEGASDESVKITDDKVKVAEESGEGKENAESGKKSLLDVDNSDNACDKFGDEKGKETANKEEVKSKTVDIADETSSNCSGSSNLLQETQTASSVGGIEEEEADAADNDNDDDEDTEAVQDGDDESAIELLEDESLAATDKELSAAAPPAKRLRLSQEGEESEKPSSSPDETRTEEKPSDDSSSNKVTAADDTTVLNKDDAEISVASTSAPIKRSHESLDLNDAGESSTESAEVASKKLRTEEETKEENIEKAAVDTQSAETVMANDSLPQESAESGEDIKDEKTLKWRAIASDIPIPLYPAPKFEPSVPKLSLDFFKRFRKTFNKMTKTDLEELVLQKVVEAIVHKSEFAEMRDLIDRQEKQITMHRMKISELSKQFRDLEMVHNRVQKDLEAKNSQVVMPVKITRAVGLQVFIPTKRSGEPLSGTMLPNQQMVGASPPQRASTQMPPPSSPPRTDVRSGTVLPSAAAAAAIMARRGCAQKVTPQRPVMDSASTAQTAGGGVYRAVLQNTLTQGTQGVTQQQQNTPRVLNKGVAMQRNRFASPAATEPQYQSKLQQQQQQMTRQQQMQSNVVRKILPKTPAAASPVTQQNQFRRPEPVNATANPAVDIYMNSLNQLPPTTGSISITPAKPKEKAVIDLTDEDEVAAAAAATNMRQRVVTTNAPNTAVGTQFVNNRAVPPLARMPAAQMSITTKAQIARQQLASIHSQKSANTMLSNITTPPGTSITRVHINSTNLAAAQRHKFGHPAPLPSTPPQPYKPGCKDPPPRPTIRISNLENGIVISWTMEEAMDHHAECVSYQIYAYQETNGPPAVDSWRHVGDVKAMLLPMAVTLTQFQEGQRYFFAVRAVDMYQRYGPFSLPKTWS